MKVTVEIAEVHKSIREIEVPYDATDAEIRKAAAKEYSRDAGVAAELDLKYSHTLDPESWVIHRCCLEDYSEIGTGR